ncbi:MAG TPA: CcoQ/FixQ family Cbb3-type cytochrome c oxidase assembly chaperone [Casimicrobiaceae bacterium]|nr:CcoQ/FixQ family Cbb3-type cytochrome c oxidase assembly chaperone [Casimicrobiaceae bacterium]
MNWIVILSSGITVLSFAVFVGIVLWASSARRRPAFARAANAPFALPDEHLVVGGNASAAAEHRS